MNQSIKASIHWLSAIDMFTASLLFTVFTAQAQPNAEAPSINDILSRGVASYQKSVQSSQPQSEMEKAIWTDPDTQLVWARCPIGQKLVAKNCQGDTKLKSRLEAISGIRNFSLGGKNDWRVPTIAELATIRKCPIYGSTGLISLPTLDGVKKYAERCFHSGNDKSAFLDEEIFPIFRPFSVVSTTPKGTNGYFWYLGQAGYLMEKQNGWEDYIVLPVRGLPATTEFDRAIEEADIFNSKRKIEIATKQLEKERQDSENAAYNKRVAIEENTFQATLNSKSPQAMYLAAGAYERNGEGGKASQIYETIIAKFPSSSWAVKANDQLNETKRSSDAQSAANQRQYNAQRASESAAQDAASKARSQCSYRIDKCEDSCRPLSGSSKSACWSSCKSLCNQF